MGNVGSRGGANGSRRSDTRRNHPPPQPAAQSQPEIIETRYVYAAARPYTINQPQYYQQPGLHGPRELQTTPPIPLPDSYGHHQRGLPPNWAAAGYSPIGPVIPAQNQMPSVELEREKAVTIRNDVNLKKETLRIEPDENNPGMFLVAFTFDATVAGSITIIFFAKEGEDSNLIPKKENFLEPVTVNFERGLGQKFRQPSGTGIDLSAENESELLRASDIDSVYPLAVKAEAMGGTMNSQITGAVFEKGRGECHVRVAKQILWVNGKRHELQEIYGIGNSHVDGDVDGNEAGKDCVICMSEPRDTTLLPCRHMCMCSGCANVWKSRTDRCPICRQPVDRLLEIRVSNGLSE